jgi:hypothetical protein
MMSKPDSVKQQNLSVGFNLRWAPPISDLSPLPRFSVKSGSVATPRQTEWESRGCHQLEADDFASPANLLSGISFSYVILLGRF